VPCARLGDARQSDLDWSSPVGCSVPLDQNRALKRPPHHCRLTCRAGFKYEKTDRTLHQEEPAIGDSNYSIEDLFRTRLLYTDGAEQVLEHLTHVVLCGVHHPAWNGPSAGEPISPLVRHETQRILQHLEKVMSHEERFVLIYCQSRVVLTGGKAE